MQSLMYDIVGQIDRQTNRQKDKLQTDNHTDRPKNIRTKEEQNSCVRVQQKFGCICNCLQNTTTPQH